MAAWAGCRHTFGPLFPAPARVPAYIAYKCLFRVIARPQGVHQKAKIFLGGDQAIAFIQIAQNGRLLNLGVSAVPVPLRDIFIRQDEILDDAVVDRAAKHRGESLAQWLRTFFPLQTPELSKKADLFPLRQLRRDP